MKKTAIYEVGDADPTPNVIIPEGMCEMERSGQYCTWRRGHNHPQHVAGDGNKVIAAWFDAEPPAPQTPEQAALAGNAWLQSLTITSAEDVTYTPFVTHHEKSADYDGLLIVGVIATMPNGDEHALTLQPSTSTDEGPGTGNVFVHEDDEPITHFGWTSGPRFYVQSPEQAQRASWEIRDRETGELVGSALGEKAAYAIETALNLAEAATGVEL